MTHLSLVLGAVCLLKATLVTSSIPTNEYQTLNGYGNNKFNALWGSANTLDGAYEFNIVPNAYADNIHSPADYGGPGARTISWSLFNSSFRYASEAGTNDLVPYFGQFICHDLADQPGGGDRFDIPVDQCDPFFDAECTGNKTIPFTRSQALTGERGYKVAKNIASTWIDAGVVYGATLARSRKIRVFDGGLLKVSSGPHGDLLPVDNETSMANGGYYLAGDERANVNLPMVCLHTLFHLEHNRRARKLAKENPNWNDETLFQEARRFVIAMLQKVHFNEYIPAILGKPLDRYEGYDRDVDPRVDTTFMTAAFRYGHSATSPLVYRIGEDWHPVPDGHLSLGRTIFNPVEIKENGMDSLLRGFVMQPESDVDVSAPSDIRNNHHILLDLVSIDIQRNRDRGVASFNNIRRALGLNPYETWKDLTPDTEVQGALARVYGDIEVRVLSLESCFRCSVTLWIVDNKPISYTISF
jgi:peroxidase